MDKNSLWVFFLPFLLLIFFYDIAFFGKSLSTSSLQPGTTPTGPYGFSGHRPEMPFSFDTAGNALVNEPNPYLIRRLLNQDALPKWNPYEGVGIPLIGNLNSEVFNPLKVFLNLFPGPFSQDIFFLLRLIVMGVFTHLFLREMKLSQAASLFGSSFFMLSGYSVWWINLHPLSTIMYLPAIFYFFERWSDRGDRLSPVLMSLFIAFAFFGGKMPDVIMGLGLLFPYALWKGLMKDSLRGLRREAGRVIAGTIAGASMAAIVLLPFIELYLHASPLAVAIRTGAASNTIPLITSVSLFQPLFLGENYFYGSWLKWTPQVILPHASVVILLFTVYAVLNRKILARVLPYLIFSLTLFCVVYGILPTPLISGVPILRSIEFLKYNAMLYFSLSVISACAFDNLLSAEGKRKKFNLSVVAASLLILLYFFLLYRTSPPPVHGHMIAVLLISLSGMILMGLVSHLSKRREIFGGLAFALLILELFLYMPKDHPERVEPYREPPYLNRVSEKEPFRITGGGSAVPPLVSNALGVYDIRDISVLIPGDSYTFSENLLGFSVPGTNNPNPLFSATSPFIDLLGVKYILSQEPLTHWRLEDEIRFHVDSMRWVRFLDAMITHTIKGGSAYGYFHAGGERRFSFFFPLRFTFETKLRVTDPFLFAGFAVKDASGDRTARVKIMIGGRVEELVVKDGEWKDRWLDISRYMGKEITVTMKGEGDGDGSIALGNFGPSPGYERERKLYEKLLAQHGRELNFLKYRGASEDIHIYENMNVMDRAFVLHKIKVLEGPDEVREVIRELEEGINFRETGLVSGVSLGAQGRVDEVVSQRDELSPGAYDKVTIKKYAPNEIRMEVESRGGLLVLSDLYYPGWKVRVNDKDEEIVKAFGLLRGVFVRGGKSEVIFTYEPRSFFMGSIASAMALFAALLFLLYNPGKKSADSR